MRIKRSLLLAFLLAPGTTLGQVYSCTGVNGETVFTDEPCAVEVPDDSAWKERERRIDEIERDMARVTREIMDAKDTYQAFVVERSPEEQVQMKTMLDEQVAELHIKNLSREN